jgi:uncharacterized MnhB-related membrane protein
VTLLLAGAFIAAAVSGWLVVASTDPGRQIFAVAANGLVLALLFFVLQAPDAALSELAVGGVVTPLLFLVALVAVKMNRGAK